MSPIKDISFQLEMENGVQRTVMGVPLNNDAATKISSFTDLAEPNQIAGGVEPWARVLRASPCLLDRETPESTGFLISCLSWFQPASENHKNSLSQCFSTSASRPRKEQEV